MPFALTPLYLYIKKASGKLFNDFASYVPETFAVTKQ